MSDTLPWAHRLAEHFYRHRNRPAHLRLVRWLRTALSLKKIRLQLRPGVVMESVDRDYVQRDILHNSGYEPATLRRFEQLLAQTTHFVDVGAHVGQYSLLAARALANRGRVFAFEPIAENASQLLHNARLSGLENVDLFGCAIGDEHRLMRMETPSAGSTGNYRLVESSSHSRLTLQVAVVPFAAIASLLPAAGVDVLKLDVEGFEARVLKSMFESGWRRPRHLLIEYNPQVFDYGLSRGLPVWLVEEGYVLRTVDGADFSADRPLPEDNLWAELRTK